jgi:hypothetical protein
MYNVVLKSEVQLGAETVKIAVFGLIAGVPSDVLVLTRCEGCLKSTVVARAQVVLRACIWRGRWLVFGPVHFAVVLVRLLAAV